MPAIHPIHEGEEQDPTCEEAEQDNDAVDPVESGVVETQLDENLSNGDKRSAELCGEQAADEEVPQSSSEEQSDGHENEKQGHMMKNQHGVLDEKSLHCLKRVAAV